MQLFALDPCHSNIAHSQVADEEERSQIWRVTANIFNKQFRTADKKRSSNWGLGEGLTTPRRENVISCKAVYDASFVTT
jgi:hypothetical protein